MTPRLHDTTGCETGLTTGYIVLTNIQPVVKPVWQPVECSYTWYSLLSNQLPNIKPVAKRVSQPCWTNSRCSFNRLSNRVVQPGLTTGCIVYTNIQPVVKRVWQPVECLYTWYSRLSDRFDNRFDSRLYRVNGAWGVWCWRVRVVDRHIMWRQISRFLLQCIVMMLCHK